MIDDEAPLSSSDAVFGRYRFPADLRRLTLYGAAIGIGVGILDVIFLHRPLSHVWVIPVAWVVYALFAWLVPMTIITPHGIRRWWSTQKSNVPWSSVSEVYVKPPNRNNKYPVHARLTNGDSIVLIGVPAKAAPELRTLVAGVSRASTPPRRG